MKRSAGVAIVLLCLTVGLALGVPSTTVTVSWLENAVRYYPDGTTDTWTNDPNGPLELVRTGKAYHVLDIGQFYNTILPDVSGSLVISGAGKLSGHVTYTSLYSDLPIRERITGTVIIDPDVGTMVGTYTQYSYAFGSEQDVHEKYPYAVPEKTSHAKGWWFIGYTEYDAHL